MRRSVTGTGSRSWLRRKHGGGRASPGTPRGRALRAGEQSRARGSHGQTWACPAGEGTRARGAGAAAAAVCGEEPVGTAGGSALGPRELWGTPAAAAGERLPPASKAPLVFQGRTVRGGWAKGMRHPWEARTEVEAGTGWGAAAGGGFGGRASRTGRGREMQTQVAAAAPGTTGEVKGERARARPRRGRRHR